MIPIGPVSWQQRELQELEIQMNVILQEPYQSNAERWRNLGNGSYSKANLVAGVIKTTYLKNAVKNYKKALEINPQDTRSYWSLANAYLDLHKPSKALSALEHALSKKDDFKSSTSLALAKTYLRTGKIDQAIEDATRVLGLDNKAQEAYRLRAEAYEKKANLIKAVSDRIEAMSLAATSPFLSIFSQAEVPVFSVSISLENTSPHLLEIPYTGNRQSDFGRLVLEGEQAYYQGDLRQARALFLQAEGARNIVEEDSCKHAVYWIGLIDWRMGELEKAQNYFNQSRGFREDDLNAKVEYMLAMSASLNRASYFYWGQFAAIVSENKEEAYANYEQFFQIPFDNVGAHEGEAATFCAEYCLDRKDYGKLVEYLAYLARCSSVSLDVLMRMLDLIHRFRKEVKVCIDLVPLSRQREKERLTSLKDGLDNYWRKILDRAKAIVSEENERLKLAEMYFLESLVKVDNILTPLEGKTDSLLCLLLRVKYHLAFSGETEFLKAKVLFAHIEEKKAAGYRFLSKEAFLFLQLKIKIAGREKNKDALSQLSRMVFQEGNDELYYELAEVFKALSGEWPLHHVRAAYRIKPSFKTLKVLIEALLDKKETLEALQYAKSFLQYPPQDVGSLKELAALLEKAGLLEESLKIYTDLREVGIPIPPSLVASIKKKASAQKIVEDAKALEDLDRKITQAGKALVLYPHPLAYSLIAESYEKKLSFDARTLDELIPHWISMASMTQPYPWNVLQIALRKMQDSLRTETCAPLVLEAIVRSPIAERNNLFTFYGTLLAAEVKDVAPKMNIKNGMPTSYVEEYCLLGACFEKKGLWKQACASYRMAQAFSLEKGIIPSLIVQASQRQKTLENALENYQKAMEGGDLAAVHSKASLLKKVGKYKEAFMIIEKASAYSFSKVKVEENDSEEKAYFLERAAAKQKAVLEKMQKQARAGLNAARELISSPLFTNPEKEQLVRLVEKIERLCVEWGELLKIEVTGLEDLFYACFHRGKVVSKMHEVLNAKVETAKALRDRMLELKASSEEIQALDEKTKNAQELLSKWEERLCSHDKHRIAAFEDLLQKLKSLINSMSEIHKAKEAALLLKDLLTQIESLEQLADQGEKDLKTLDLYSLIGFAYAYERAEEWEEAILLYEIALYQYPHDRYVLFRLVYLLQELNKIEEKMTEYQNAIASDKRMYGCFYALLGELYALQNHKDAKTCFQYAIEREPEEPWLYERLVAFYVQENLYEEQILEQIQNLKQKEILMGRYFHMNAYYEKALEYFTAAEKKGLFALEIARNWRAEAQAAFEQQGYSARSWQRSKDYIYSRAYALKTSSQN